MPRPMHQWNRLAGRIAIVTGAGSPEGGIGRSIAVLLAGEGARIVCVDNNAERLQDTCAQIVVEGGEAIDVVGDVSDVSECARIVHEAALAFGGVDILVNNVGISPQAAPLVETDFDVWSKIIDTNLRSAAAMSSFVTQAMKAGRSGAIVNIASIAGIVAYGGVSYGPSKAALIHLTSEIAVMQGKYGIRVNAVAPGHIFTPHVAGTMTSEMRETRRNIAPLNIEGDAWDVASAVLFLVSDEARFITGVTIPVDGGATKIGALAANAALSRQGG